VVVRTFEWFSAIASTFAVVISRLVTTQNTDTRSACYCCFSCVLAASARSSAYAFGNPVPELSNNVSSMSNTAMNISVDGVSP
jgi:hypothetical protein